MVAEAQKVPWSLLTFPGKACVWGCGSEDGFYVKTNDQNVLYCAKCERHQKANVPKRFTGEPQRRVVTRVPLKPGQRSRIRERDQYICAECHAPEPEGLEHQIGHFLSWEEGIAAGATEEELNSDHNLFLQCEACNLGRGKRSFEPRSLVGPRFRTLILRAAVQRESEK